MTAQSEILALRARGASDAAIGRALGVNSSYISQVARGKKSGEKYAGALGEIRSSGRQLPRPGQGPLVQLPRRTTKAGTPARVRQRPRQATTTAGRGVTLLDSRGERSITNKIARAPRDAQVRLTVTFNRLRRYGAARDSRHQEVQLFGKGGWNATVLQGAIEDTGGLKAFIESYANDPRSMPGVEGASGIERIHLEILAPAH